MDITTPRPLPALITVVALAATMLLSAPAHGAQAIQPGIGITTGGSGCTLAWMFQRVDVHPDGATEVHVFGSTAAHCVDEVGQTVTHRGTDTRIGEVAFVGDAEEEGRDYAFIAIDEARYGDVDPSMAGHPEIPTGLSTAPEQGDTMQFSGWGTGVDLTQQTREQRTGVLNRLGEKEHSVTGVVTPGDSGGPVADLDDGNTAFGIVNTVGAGVNSAAMTVVTAGEGGANLSFVLVDAAARGFSPGDLCVVDQPCG